MDELACGTNAPASVTPEQRAEAQQRLAALPKISGTDELLDRTFVDVLSVYEVRSSRGAPAACGEESSLLTARPPCFTVLVLSRLTPFEH